MVFWDHYWPESVAVVCAIVFSVSIFARGLFLPPSQEYTGFVQDDQPVYYACAREIFENGNGLFYANPYSNLVNSPRLFTHFYFFLVGWIWRLTGVSFTLIDGAVRLLFGPVYLLLAARLFRHIHGWQRWTNWLLLLLLVGSGVAWLAAAMLIPVHIVSGDWHNYEPSSMLASFWTLFLEDFNGAENGYAWWHVDLFRNIVYSTEVFYHVLFFLTLVMFVKGYRWGGIIGVFLTWWAHPYTGVTLAAICCLWLGAEYGLGNRRLLKPLIVLSMITAVFLLYYFAILPRNAEYRSVYTQMCEFKAPMRLSKILVAYGFLVPLSACALFLRSTRPHLRRPEIRLCVIWLGVVGVLNFHDKLLPFMQAKQPLHFSHGYLFVPMALLSPLGLEAILQARYGEKAKTLFAPVAAAICLFHLPDNVIWCSQTIAGLPRMSRLFGVDKSAMEMLHRMDSLRSHEVILDIALPQEYANVVTLIPVVTHHTAVRAHGFNTPYIYEKRNMIDSFTKEPSADILRSLCVSAIFTGKDQLPLFRQRLGAVLGEVLLEDKKTVLVRCRP